LLKWVPLLAVIAVAAALRFWALGYIPPGLYHDEAFNGLDALGVLEGERPVFLLRFATMIAAGESGLLIEQR